MLLLLLLTAAVVAVAEAAAVTNIFVSCLMVQSAWSRLGDQAGCYTDNNVYFECLKHKVHISGKILVILKVFK